MTKEETHTFNLKRSTKKRTLASGNQMVSANDRLFHHTRAEIQAYLRQLGSEVTPKHYYDEKNTCRVIVTIFPPTKRRMDPPNWYPTVKALVDGLTDAGQWSDDNSNIIKEMIFRHGGLSNEKQTYRIDLTIQSMGERGDTDA